MGLADICSGKCFIPHANDRLPTALSAMKSRRTLERRKVAAILLSRAVIRPAPVEVVFLHPIWADHRASHSTRDIAEEAFSHPRDFAGARYRSWRVQTENADHWGQGGLPPQKRRHFPQSG